MTLNIFFFSITFKKREVSLQEAVQQEMVEKLYEENKDRQISMLHFM
ncbi:YrzI family small protein [Neobacillus sp.]|nr:YrzI family small protein [Neobacillus sp.]